MQDKGEQKTKFISNVLFLVGNFNIKITIIDPQTGENQMHFLYKLLCKSNFDFNNIQACVKKIMHLTKEEYFKKYGVSLPTVGDFIKINDELSLTPDYMFVTVIDFIFNINKNIVDGLTAFSYEHLKNKLTTDEHEIIKKNGGIDKLKEIANKNNIEKQKILNKLRSDHINYFKEKLLTINTKKIQKA